MWVIFDSSNCHLFSSNDNNHLDWSQKSGKNLPNSTSKPVVAIQDSNKHNLFEASNVCKVDDK
jgi:hypothetical protein